LLALFARWISVFSFWCHAVDDFALRSHSLRSKSI
jgi:hypothetical protein